jgi:hypothetical protein
MQNWIVEALALFLNVLALFALTALGTRAAILATRQHHSTTVTQRKKNTWLEMAGWIVAIASLILGLILQLLAASNHHAYDTDAIKYYDEKFDNMEKKRISAATVLKEYYEKKNWDAVTNSTDDLDYVLGFWDELGYDEQHGKISANVAWEYFYDDIADYYQGSIEYIAVAQKDDPTWYENIKPLFDDVTKIQAQRKHRLPADMKISGKDYLEYLRSEIDLKNDK